jgi:hypothetical protein
MDAWQAQTLGTTTPGVARESGSTPARRRLCSLLLTAGLLGLAPGFAYLAPPSHWHHPVLLAGLLALAACTVLSEVALKRDVPVQFDAITPLVVLILLVGGPVPALIAWLLPDLTGRVLLRRYRLFTPGLAANVASYGWCVLAGAGVLAVTDAASISPQVAPSILAVGLALEMVNFAIARVLFGTLYQGYRLVPLVREEFVNLLGTHVALFAFATLCAVLIAPLDALLLLLVAPVVLVPQLVLPALARTRSVAELPPASATRLYVSALATHLRLDRQTRHIALAACDLLHDPSAPLGVKFSDIREVQLTAWHATERWDGQGTPAGLAARTTPLASRLLAVARTWSELTAAGALQLPQAQAILSLELQAASALDPSIVAAAGEIVTTEAAFADLEGFQPKLHSIPLPYVLREYALPRALAGYTPA